MALEIREPLYQPEQLAGRAGLDGRRTQVRVVEQVLAASDDRLGARRAGEGNEVVVLRVA